MKNYSWIVILANLLLFLGIFNHSILQKEQLMEEGTLVLMELAPVDPRSLIQGDYMRLDYGLGQKMAQDSIPSKGLCALEIDQRGVAQYIRYIQGTEDLRAGEFPIKYSKRSWGSIRFGAESYFFQEGKAENFEGARYGGIRLDTKGNSLLIGLYDENLQKLE